MRLSKNKIVTIFLIAIFFIVAFWVPDLQKHQIKYVQRSTGEIKTEKVVGEKWLVWLYNNPLGRLTTGALVKRKIVSCWYGDMMDDPNSQKKIEPFIKDYSIDMNIFQKKDFANFNDFFVRKIKPSARPIAAGEFEIASPADGKLLAWQNIEDRKFLVKGYQFDLATYLQDEEMANKFAKGSMILFRLCPTDYHRYHFPVSGIITQSKKITGNYYSVSPIAIKEIVELFCLNKREYTLVQTKQFGDVVMSEIGATMVGSIISTYLDKEVEKGEEKGYFKFGGSSVLLLFEKGKIIIDKDLLENTRKSMETEVKMGEKIATSKIKY